MYQHPKSVRPGWRPTLLCLTSLCLSGTAIAQAGSVIEDLRIDANSQGFPFTLTFLENFGGSLAGLGDLNSDGNLEILIGSPNDSVVANKGGLVQILSLQPGGSIFAGIEISEGLGGFTGDIELADAFGTSVARIGDLDGDGIPEIAVGAPGDNDGAFVDEGAVYVLFLNFDGSVRTHQKISTTSGGFTGSLGFFARFGTSLAEVGDLNGDGIPDLAVGAPQAGNFSGFGAVWILYLTSSGTVLANFALDETEPRLAEFVTAASEFGYSVTSAGDLDGNGWPDLFVGNPTYEDLSGNEGVVVTILFDGPSSIKSATGIDLGDLFPRSDRTITRFGDGLERIGDLNGDGTIELAVTALDSVASILACTSEVWIVSVDESGVATNFHSINPLENSIEIDVDRFSAFGSGLAAIGDLDGDGVGDLAVGAELDNSNGLTSGAIHLLRLSNGDPVATIAPSATNGCPPLAVTFTDESAGTGLSSWFWDFGDGCTSSLPGPTHTFLAEGSYTVTLEVTGADGEARAIAKDLIVVNNDPVVDFTASLTNGTTPLPVDFTDLSSVDVTSWAWTFGDGGTSSDQNPTYVYGTPGTYDVTLLGTCPTGGTVETKSAYILVDDRNQASVSSNNGTGVNPVVFTSNRDPVLGTTWLGTVDPFTAGATGPLSFLYGFALPLTPGVLIGAGELLIDPLSDLVVVDVQPMGGFGLFFHVLPVPNDVALIGFTFSAQVVLTNAGGAILTNRLDLRLGL